MRKGEFIYVYSLKRVYSDTIELLYLAHLIGECCHSLTFLFVCDFGINLCGADVRMSEHLRKGFNGNAVSQTDFRLHSVAASMPRNLFFDTAESDDFLDVLAGGNILRNGQEVIPEVQVEFCTVRYRFSQPSPAKEVVMFW